MNFTIQNPQFGTAISAALNPVAGAGLSGGINLNTQMNAPAAGIGIGAGNIDGIATGLVNITTGAPLTIDTSNLAVSALDLYLNAATAAFLVAMAIQIMNINTGDSPSETLTIGGGSNPILVASAGLLCLSESYAWQKVKSGGLTIGGGNKNILLTASAGTMTALVTLWTRSG